MENFIKIILIFGISSFMGSHCASLPDSGVIGNVSNSDKDMYVIHATVYEVGILTNKTDNNTKNNTGEQESVTFYHTNGNKVDLGGIPQPLLTNVTAHSVVGLAPVDNMTSNQVGVRLSQLPSIQHPTNVVTSGANSITMPGKYKRSLDNIISLFKRSTSNVTLAKITNGSAIIPPEVGVQSIALPPLLSLNNNLSDIPVPIPNTSIVKYAKVNTVVKSP